MGLQRTEQGPVTENYKETDSAPIQCGTMSCLLRKRAPWQGVLVAEIIPASRIQNEDHTRLPARFVFVVHTFYFLRIWYIPCVF